MTSRARFFTLTQQFTLFLLLFIGGLAATRIVFEWSFPRTLLLANPLVVLPLTAVFTLIIWIQFGQRLSSRALYFAPLLLNLLYLGETAVLPHHSRLLFFGAWWLVGLLFSAPRLEKRPILGMLYIWLALLPIYLSTVSHTVGRDDTFEFQVVTPQLGIVHPTGYPLYLLLGRPFTALPFGSPAFRLNLASIVYACLAMGLLFWLLNRWWQRALPAALTAVAVGLSTTFWSQAIIAEVYALHALITVSVLALTFTIHNSQFTIHNYSIYGRSVAQRHLRFTIYDWPVVAIACLLGLGMTNHVTTIFLLPAALFVLFYRHFSDESFNLFRPKLIAQAIIAGLLPLLLYAYLPLRWRAVNGEPMGTARFVDWVVGGRFQDALVWRAWLDDPTRYRIVGQLFLDNWGLFNLILAGLGLGYLLYRSWQTAVPLLLVFFGYSFYCLNYYVPDLAVFLIPAQIVVGIFWGAAFWAGLEAGDWGLGIGERGSGSGERGLGRFSLMPLFLVLFLVSVMTGLPRAWVLVDQSEDDGRERWGTAVLNLPLDQNAAILADSDKFPPLFYLQQSADVRPDLDISVWPDEAAYRAQLNGRLAAGQTVYLARFLPGLEAAYHLNSEGPLLHVGTEPQTTLPTTATPIDLRVGDLRLVGYELQPIAHTNPQNSAVTLYWQSEAETPAASHIYVRWAGFEATTGQHPANNNYPIVAWKDDEIVADYHEWSYPSIEWSEDSALEIAVGPPFSRPDSLQWQPIEDVRLHLNFALNTERPLNVYLNNQALTGITHAETIRPQTDLEILFDATGQPDAAPFSLVLAEKASQIPMSPIFERAVDHRPFRLVREVEAVVENGRYQLIIQSDEPIICGWMRVVFAECTVGEVLVDGVPLPENATNFEDKIALLGFELDEATFQPGGQLALTLEWQALAQMDQNYTVFVQVLTEQDQIVGQVDSWPVQGTRPTSQWEVGETVRDPYLVQLGSDLPAGRYKIKVGFYLLETLRRLTVLNEQGEAVTDAFEVTGLQIE